MLGEAEMEIIQRDIAAKNESKSTIKVSVADIFLFLSMQKEYSQMFIHLI